MIDHQALEEISILQTQIKELNITIESRDSILKLASGIISISKANTWSKHGMWKKMRDKYMELMHE